MNTSEGWEPVSDEEVEAIRKAIQRNNIKVVCAFCYKDIKDERTIIGMGLYPEDDPDLYQQFWVHKECISQNLHPDMVSSLRDELK